MPEQEKRISLSEVFLSLGLPESVRILDVACGIGVVAEELKAHGYHNIDGLDPIQGYLNIAQQKHLYKNVFKEFIDVRQPTSIENEVYDVVICCAGFFQGLISPKAFPELIRITKPGIHKLCMFISLYLKDFLLPTEGLIIWNIAEGFEDYSEDFKHHDKIVQHLISSKSWKCHNEVQKFGSMVFTDSGAAHLKGYQSGGLASAGFVHIMQKLSQ